jgi:hypothetical protein
VFREELIPDHPGERITNVLGHPEVHLELDSSQPFRMQAQQIKDRLTPRVLCADSDPRCQERMP